MRLFHSVIIASLASGVLTSPAISKKNEPSTDHASTSKLGAVASESSVCSRVGTDLIKKGGSAADAVSEASSFSLLEVILEVTIADQRLPSDRWLGRCFASESLVRLVPIRCRSAILMSGLAMYHSGIGGGGFMLVRGPKGKYEFIDFRETAPAAAFEDMYKDNVASSLQGGLAR